jgi:hypothetical protein
VLKRFALIVSLALVSACAADVTALESDLDFDRPLRGLILGSGPLALVVHNEQERTRLGGVEVLVAIPGTTIERRGLTNEAGIFELPDVESGTFDVHMTKDGFYGRSWLGLPARTIALALAAKETAGVTIPEAIESVETRLALPHEFELPPSTPVAVILNIERHGPSYHFVATSMTELFEHRVVSVVGHRAEAIRATAYMMTNPPTSFLRGENGRGWSFFESAGVLWRADLLLAGEVFLGPTDRVMTIQMEPPERQSLQFSWSRPETWLVSEPGWLPLVSAGGSPTDFRFNSAAEAAEPSFEASISWPMFLSERSLRLTVRNERLSALSEAKTTEDGGEYVISPVLRPRDPPAPSRSVLDFGAADERTTLSVVRLRNTESTQTVIAILRGDRDPVRDIDASRVDFAFVEDLLVEPIDAKEWTSRATRLPE